MAELYTKVKTRLSRMSQQQSPDDVSQVPAIKQAQQDTAAHNVEHSEGDCEEEEEEEECEPLPEIDYRIANSVYDFTVHDTHCEQIKLDKYQGKLLIIVNIASQCGLTKNQYEKLTKLHSMYAEHGLQILSFPCNQFGGQMPEADGGQMICHLKNANAQLGDIFRKINVNGSDANPLYKYLKMKQSGTLGPSIKWNFTKFLINKEGQPVDRFAPTTDPMNMVKSIEALLAEGDEENEENEEN